MNSTSASPRLTRIDGSPVRVLVVDDEANLTELLSMALRYEGWEVQAAGTGLKAVRAAKEFQPDAVVLEALTAFTQWLAGKGGTARGGPSGAPCTDCQQGH